MPNEALKILLVEDDPSVATALERALADHRPIVETDAKAAYRRLVGGEWFDAVVCDASMPEISGRRLLATVRQLADPPVFVLMSGGEIFDPDADVVLHKPFPAEYLLELLAIFSRRRASAPTRRLPRMEEP